MVPNDRFYLLHQVTPAEYRRVSSATCCVAYGDCPYWSDCGVGPGSGENVPFFVVQAHVETLDLGLPRDTQPHRDIDDLEDCECADDGQSPGDDHGDHLALPERTALDQAEQFAVGAPPVARVAKTPVSNAPKVPATSVDAEDVERIVIAEPGFHSHAHRIADQ